MEKQGTVVGKTPNGKYILVVNVERAEGNRQDVVVGDTVHHKSTWRNGDDQATTIEKLKSGEKEA